MSAAMSHVDQLACSMNFTKRTSIGSTQDKLLISTLGKPCISKNSKLKKKKIKNMLNCCKLGIVFRNKTRLGNNFHFKDRISKDATSGVEYKIKCGLCNKR